MRSTDDAPQLPLWEEAPARSPRVRGSRPGHGDPGIVVVLQGREFASRGWGPGTVLLAARARSAVRGELVVVRDGDRELVGVLGLDVGRRALFTDRGSTWLGEGARVVGVVVAVEAPLLF